MSGAPEAPLSGTAHQRPAKVRLRTVQWVLGVVSPMKFIDRLDNVAKRFERLFSGNTPSDPLYMTNRTVGQKVRMGVLIGTPVLAIGVFMALALNNYFDPAPSPQKLEAAAAGKQPAGEISAKVLPNVDKGFTTDYSREVDDR